MAKFENDLDIEEGNEIKAHHACKLSKEVIVNYNEDLEEDRAFFMSELERLNGDYEVVDEIISIFKQELRGIDEVIRN